MHNLDRVNNNTITSQALILDELLPIAKQGLEKAQVEDIDIVKYLGIIEARVKSGKTGSQWMSDSFVTLKKESTKGGSCDSINSRDI